MAAAMAEIGLDVLFVFAVDKYASSIGSKPSCANEDFRYR